MGKLHLVLEGLRSTKGSLRVCLWSDGEGFPDCRKNTHVQRVNVAADAAMNGLANGVAGTSGEDGEERIVTLDLTDLPAGEYGISVIHDENDNRRLDKGFIGLPAEGVGFSNNAKATFGPPKFKKARFPVAGETAQRIKIRYFL
ncbi:MAG: DUF2141 domain-containing protein [Pseudomonadota bacterium]